MAERILVITCLLLAGCGGGEPPRSPLDVVLILADDLRYDSLGINGSTLIATPQLDRLAREGATFDSALVTTSLCCPGRASLLTGKYPHVTGVINNVPAPDVPGGDVLAGHAIFPELFQDAGYDTAYIGKWHLPNEAARPYRGFDHWASYEGQGVYFDQPLNVNGRTTRTRGYSTDVFVDMAIEWIEERQGRPYLLVVAPKSCHYPFDPPEHRAGELEAADIRFPASLDDPIESLPVHLRRLRERPNLRAVTEDRRVLRLGLQRYSETVLGLDDAIGRLVQALSDAGSLDRTFLVFTSDNGLMWGEHGIPHKMCTYEPSIRVPLLIRHPPSFPAGTRERRPVLNIDLPVTLLDVAGIAIPGDMQGESLLELSKSGADWRDATLHYESVDRDSPWGEPVDLAVRTDRWKYQRFRAPRLEEFLFDLHADPDERRNLVPDVAHGEVVEEMRLRMASLMERYDVPPAWFDEVP